MVTAVEGDTKLFFGGIHALWTICTTYALAFTGYHNIAENVAKMEEDNNNTYIRAYQYLTN